MDKQFNIYFDRLKGGQTEQIQVETTPEFLDINEEGLSFHKPVSIQGETYLAEDHLVLHLKIQTEATVACSVCNGPVCIPIDISDFYHTVEHEEIRSRIFDYTEELREAIVLQVPPFAECNEGKCPDRAILNQYLKKTETPKTEEGETYFPFSGL